MDWLGGDLGRYLQDHSTGLGSSMSCPRGSSGARGASRTRPAAEFGDWASRWAISAPSRSGSRRPGPSSSHEGDAGSAGCPIFSVSGRSGEILPIDVADRILAHLAHASSRGNRRRTEQHDGKHGDKTTPWFRWCLNAQAAAGSLRTPSSISRRPLASHRSTTSSRSSVRWSSSMSAAVT